MRYIIKLNHRIVIVTNAISNTREIKQLNKNEINLGGQGLVPFSSLSNISKFNVQTIYMDDLLSILPIGFDRAIIKVDIEGFELKAFQKAFSLFEAVKIVAIFLEWTKKYDRNRNSINEVEEFLQFIYTRGFECKSPASLQTFNKDIWNFWPDDLVFIHKNFDF
jgi:FkbM family methyltransferase